MKHFHIATIFQVKGEASKNWQLGSESLNNLIIFSDDGIVNPGRLFELYLMTLNPKNDRLFQRCRNAKAKSFNLHDFKHECFYENSPVGHTTFGKTLPLLCEIVDKPRLTNHSTRKTVITNMQRNNYTENEVMAVSGDSFR